MNLEAVIVARIVRSERGIAFVVSLVTMLVLVILGYGLLVATDGSTRTDNGMKAQTAAFEAADSGIELAREKLRACLAGTGTSSFSCTTKKTLSQLLAAAGGGIDSTTLAGFGSTSATTNATGNTPFVASDSTTLSPAAFQVFLTNDPGDGVATTTDSGIGNPGHNRVTLTSFAAGANNIGYAVVQSVVEAPLEGLDGLFQATLILPGPDVNFAAPDSNPYGIDNADCKATIATTSNTARTTVYNNLPSGRRDTDHYNDGCSPSPGTLGVYNFLSTVPNPYDNAGSVSPATPAGMPTVGNNMITIDWWNQLLEGIKAVANFRSSSDAGFNLGTATNPQIVYIEGNYDVGGNATGYGILVCTGNLTLHGNTNYTGLILAVGNGNVTVSGGGNGGVTGSMVVANTTPWVGNSAYVSTPSYNANGGGTSAWGLGGDLINNIPMTAITAPRRISFVQLR